MVRRCAILIVFTISGFGAAIGDDRPNLPLTVPSKAKAMKATEDHPPTQRAEHFGVVSADNLPIAPLTIPSKSKIRKAKEDYLPTRQAAEPAPNTNVTDAAKISQDSAKRAE